MKQAVYFSISVCALALSGCMGELSNEAIAARFAPEQTGLPAPPEKGPASRSLKTVNGVGGACAVYSADAASLARIKAEAKIQVDHTTDADPSNDQACLGPVPKGPADQGCKENIADGFGGSSYALVGASCKGPNAYAIYVNDGDGKVAYESIQRQ
jgi:hypothetical protein